MTDLQDIFLAASWGSESCSGGAFLAVCQEIQESLDSDLLLVLRLSKQGLRLLETKVTILNLLQGFDS